MENCGINMGAYIHSPYLDKLGRLGTKLCGNRRLYSFGRYVLVCYPYVLDRERALFTMDISIENSHVTTRLGQALCAFWLELVPGSAPAI